MSAIDYSDGQVFVNSLAALPSTKRVSSSFSKFSSWQKRQAKWGRLDSAKSNASTTDDTTTLMFEIEDTGSGIDAEHREAMFQNFVSLPNSSTRYGGTGVGLGIVRSLIELMGGQIEIVDKSSPGALFRFTVTLKVDDKADDSDNSSGDHLAEETRPIWAGGRPVTTPTSTLQMRPSVAQHHKYTPTTDVAAAKIQPRQKVVLVMPEGRMQAEVAASWFKHHGCHVSKVSSWKCMQVHLDSFWHQFMKAAMGFERPLSTQVSKSTEIESAQHCNEEASRCLLLLDSALIPNEEGNGPDLQQLEGLGRDMRRRLRMVDASVVSTGRHADDGYGDGDDDDDCGDQPMMPCLAMVLLTTASTPPCLQRAAQSAGFKIIQKPLVPSRLMPFLRFLRGNGNLPSDTGVPRLSSQNVNKVMGLLPTVEKPVGKLQSSSPRHKTASSKEDTWREGRRKVEGRGSPSSSSSSSSLSSSSSSLRRPETASLTAAVTCSAVIDGICSSTEEDGVTKKGSRNLASPTTATSLFGAGLEALCVEAAEAGCAPKESLRVLAEGLHHNLVPLSTSPHRLRPQGDEEQTPFSSSSSSASAPASAHTPGIASSTSRSNDNNRGVAPTPGLAGGGKVGGLRVLLVEDTSVMAQIARKQLEKMGASVWWAQDGQIAVEMFAASHGIIHSSPNTTATTTAAESSSSSTPQSVTPPHQPSSASPSGQPFDVIVMDCQMPRLDGYGATAAIRHLEISLDIPRTPIIALTAHAMTTDRKKCLDAGMDEYLAKPLNVKLLQAMLEKLLGSKDAAS